jgi:hypothetical protein
MFEITQVYLSPSTRAAVLRMLQAQRDPRSVAAVVEQALQAWLHQAACADPLAAHAAARGYQWKSLFLPEGTCLRFDYRHRTYHAEVRGDRIVYEGKAYSPRQLLLHVTGTVRNAWRELWVRSPGDFRWHLADTRRHILRRAPRTPRAKQRKCDGAYAASDPLLRSLLYRDDVVRADQPDLSSGLTGGGRSGAGRAGPRDRRYCGYVAEAMATRIAALRVAALSIPAESFIP